MNKKILFCAALIAMAFSPLLAADEIVGVWLRDSGKSKLKIEKAGATYTSTVCWLQDAGATDKHKGGAKILGTRNGTFRAQGNLWVGSIYNAEDGKTYSATATVNGNTLLLKGGYKVPLVGVVGKTAKFSRSTGC